MADMNKPWWLWEGAAVRWKDEAHTIEEFFHTGYVGMVATCGYCHGALLPMDKLIPIENPAVIYAPMWATHVFISKAGDFQYRNETDLDGWDPSYNWPQCPANLKGKTWPLPRSE